MIITIKGADFSAKNIGTLSTWTILTALGSGATYSGNRLVDKDSSLSATITIADGYELGSAGVSVIMGTTDVTSSAATVNGNTITISIATVTGNVTINVPTLITGGEIPNYTFIINATPSNATVTLTAPGYTQNGNSIIVPDGTTVSWSVSADGYIEQNGTWTVNGENNTESIILIEAPTGNLMDVKSRLDANTEFVSRTDNPTQWGPFRYSVLTVENDYVKIDGTSTGSTLWGIRMGVPDNIPENANIKASVYVRTDDIEWYEDQWFRLYYDGSSYLTTFKPTTEWAEVTLTRPFDGTWDRLQISSPNPAKVGAFYVKNFSLTVV